MKGNMLRLEFSKMKAALLRFNFEKFKGNGVSLYRLASGKLALDIVRRGGRNAKQTRIGKRSKRNSNK